MGSDLHQPLGQNRKERGRRQWVGGLFRTLRWLLPSIAVIGFSVYTALTPLPLGDGIALQPTETAALLPPSETAITTNRPANPPLSAERPGSGANVVRQTLPDGSVVTTYTPRPRTNDGPVLVDAPRMGQDPRMASVPNEQLLEDSPEGRIPVVGPDGLRPVEQYARPWSGTRGTRIAIVIGGLGLSQTGTQNALRGLPEDVTLAFAATGNSLQRWMQEARRGGHEILLQVPFEPFDYPQNDPGRGTLLTSQEPAQNLASLHEAMAKITNYTGIMNYMGGRFLADQNALEPVMRDITERGLLFLDDGSSAGSLTGDYAKALGTPHAFADLQIDDQINEQAILKRLDELERIAARKGSAIAVGFAFDETVAAVSKWSEEARRRGIEFVGISALALETSN